MWMQNMTLTLMEEVRLSCRVLLTS